MKQILKNYTQPAFLICAAILAVSVAGMQYTIKKLNITLTKLPIALVKSFDEIDEEKLSPYKVLKKTKIDNPAILESLGTEDYIQWLLEDTTAPQNSPTRYCSLFLTYYTGINDRIPHVPEECYFGAGNQEKGRHDIDIQIDNAGPQAKSGKLDIPVRQLVFTAKSKDIWAKEQEFSVMYFFKVNGEFAGTRTSARNILGKNIFGKHSYFSKVEWRFFGNINSANAQESVDASKKLLETVIAILESDHWPDIIETQDESQDIKD